MRIDAHTGFDAHLEPQVSFILDAAGKLAVNVLGRYERFESDLRQVMSHVGVRLQNVPQALHSIRHRDYRIYYTPYSRNAVASFYKADIELFDYTF